MNFQNLIRIESPDFYLDVAFGRAKDKAEQVKAKRFKDRISKIKSSEIARIDAINNSLTKSFTKIIDSFPRVDELPEFYVEMVKLTIDYPKLKRSLGGVNWAVKQVQKFSGFYLSKLKRSREVPKMTEARRSFYGRISSVVKQIRKELFIVEESRKIMKGFPAIKTSLRSVCLFGFPNVGKTTLLSKLTGADPEINNYAFTTKRINLGYSTIGKEKVQFIDTPGTLDRFNKMNDVEKQAHLALKHVSDLIIYIFDPTESYPLSDQVKLFNKLKKEQQGKKIIVFLSKTDIVEDKKKVEELKKKYDAISDIKEVKENVREICKDMTK